MQANVFDLAEQDTILKRVTYKEYAGPCPRCHGTDRFHVQPNRRPGGAWFCRNCWPAETNGWGDVIEYLRQIRGLSFKEARDLAQGDDSSAQEETTRHYEPVQRPSDSFTWQRDAERFAADALAQLWKDEGKAVLDYLHTRGLRDDIIRKARLGATHWTFWDRRTAPCVVFPLYAHGRYWRNQMRDITPGISKKQRYEMTGGSSNYGLYLGDALQAYPNKCVFLVEGELDALSLAQEAGDLVVAVATGSISGAQTDAWIMRLAAAPHVFVAFDNEIQAEQSARFWLNVLPRATRWLAPMGKDANEMLMSGLSLRLWVEAALSTLAEPATEPITDDTETTVNNINSGYNLAETDAKPITDDTGFTQFLYRIDRIGLEVFGPGCTITLIPDGYTLADRVSDLEKEWREKEREKEREIWDRDRARRAKPKSMAWTREQVRKHRQDDVTL